MNKRPLRIGVALTLVLLIAAFFAFDLHQLLTLEAFKAQQQALQDAYALNPARFIAGYMTLYIVATALSIPGATVLTLAGGALFGFGTATVLVSFGSTIGATLACGAARFLFRDAVQGRFAERLRRVNEGMERDGVFYLLSLRLIPIIPFFVVNLVMGLTTIGLLKFYLVSQAGMLPATLVYVNAGTQLGQIESVRDILAPQLWLAFLLLGFFPWIARKLVNVLRARRELRRFRKPPRFDYNIVVIGAGSAGLVSAYLAAALKAKVALIEKHRMGGDCLNTGCVPSKALIRSASVLNLFKRARDFGLRSAGAEPEFSAIMQRVQNVIGRIEPHDSIERYSALGVECIAGDARIASPYEVRVGTRTLTTRNIIVATGARPRIPNIPGIEHVHVRTSDDIWQLREQPGRLLVLGGGPIGCELAQAFARLGSEVTLVQRNIQLLPAEDTDAAEALVQRLRSEGVRVLTEHQAERFESDGGQQLICTDADGKEVRIGFDVALIALGRAARVDGFGLEQLGVRLRTNGTLEVDEYQRTNIPNIYACGDVAGPYQLTHAASHQAWYCAVNALFAPWRQFRTDYRVMPWCTFTDPEVARVGLNEKEAREHGILYEVTRYGLDDLDRAIADSEAHGFVKVLTAPGKDRILGVTIVGPHAGELIAEFVLAMKHGLGLNKILGTVHIYPTLAEANKYAAGQWRRAHTPHRVMRWLEKLHTWRRG